VLSTLGHPLQESGVASSHGTARQMSMGGILGQRLGSKAAFPTTGGSGVRPIICATARR